MSIDSFILKPLLKAATGPYESLSVAKTLNACSSQLKMAEGKAGWIEALDRLAEQFDSAEKNAQEQETSRVSLARMERNVCRDPVVLEALVSLESSGSNEARILLHFDEDIRRRYDGDASQRLLKEFAATCDPVFAEAILWLAQQPCARHAFAKKENGKPPRSTEDGDLSHLPNPSDENETQRKNYYEYLWERRRLFEEKYGVNEDYALTDEDQKKADELWRELQRQRGISPGALRTRRSRIMSGKPWAG